MSVIGLRVGPFEIVQPAEVPSAGDWYRARRAGITRRQPEEVLVRLLSSEADGSERAGLQACFHNLRAVEDPRIPRAVALYEGIGAMAIDAPEGASLADVIRARAKGTIALTPSTLLDLALEVAETLQHAHHRNRFHGHLEPASVRLTAAGKLFIFGFEDPAASPSALWAPPESARGGPTGEASDQWALGAIIAGLIAGVTPWAEHPSLEGRTDHMVAPIEDQWPALARLVRRLLEPDPENRHASMHPVRQELLALARKAGGTSERLELGRAMARRLGQSLVSTPPFAPASDASTSAETVLVPQAAPFTDASMDVPEVGVEPPPVVERVAAGLREPTPLVAEALDVVQPEVDEKGLPQLLREGEVGLSALTPMGWSNEDDGDAFADAPTVRVSNVAALFSDDDDIVGPGEGPTAVPYTDPGDSAAVEEQPAEPLVAVAEYVPTTLLEAEISVPSAAPPVLDIHDSLEDPGPVEPTVEIPKPIKEDAGVPIQKVAPILIGLMLLLMVVSVIWMRM